jgi:hypothetical protein
MKYFKLLCVERREGVGRVDSFFFITESQENHDVECEHHGDIVF